MASYWRNWAYANIRKSETLLVPGISDKGYSTCTYLSHNRFHALNVTTNNYYGTRGVNN